MSRRDISNIKIKAEKVKNKTFEHENSAAGIVPFVRGVLSTQYIHEPILFVKKIEANKPFEANKEIKEEFENGCTNFSLLLNFNNDNYIENSGILIRSFEDMKLMLESIPLDKINLILKSDNAEDLCAVFFIGAAQAHNFELNSLSFSIQNKNPQLNSTHKTLLEFTTKNSSNLKSLILTTPQLNVPHKELAQGFLQGLKIIRTAFKLGFNIDEIASKIVIETNHQTNFTKNIALNRAARLVWASVTNKFKPNNQNSMALQLHTDLCKKSDLKNSSNILSQSIFGGIQKIVVAKNFDSETQKQFLNSSLIFKTVDPFAGSFSVEEQTNSIYLNTLNELQLLLSKNNLPLEKIINTKPDKNFQNNKENLLNLAIEKLQVNASLSEIVQLFNKV